MTSKIYIRHIIKHKTSAMTEDRMGTILGKRNKGIIMH